MKEKIAVLLVEDDEGHAKLIGKAFRGLENQFSLNIVTSLKEARDFLAQNSPDAIVSDLLLPDGRGIDLFEGEKRNFPYPLIVMTSFGDEAVAVEAMKAGALDYVVKSDVTLRAMPRVIKRVLREWGHLVKRREAEEELKRHNEILEEAVKVRTAALEDSNRMLQQQIKERMQTQQELEKYKNQLEELVEERTKQLFLANKELERLANFDALTGIANRRNFMIIIEEEWKRATRNKLQLSLLMIDVDYFKLYNDHYGHQLGDECLQKVALMLRESMVRTGDIPARYGGEEFVVVLPATDNEGAYLVAERLRKKVEEAKIPHEFSPIDNYVTISIGTATMAPNGELATAELIKAADDALYRAKQKGRNRCECS